VSLVVRASFAGQLRFEIPAASGIRPSFALWLIDPRKARVQDQLPDGDPGPAGVGQARDPVVCGADLPGPRW
jgi:hypothetical protein